MEREAHRLERRGAAALTEAERARLGRARASLQIVRRHERGLAGRLGAVLALLAAIYASLGIAQIGVLALSRDFHDALSRDLSLLVHLAPEDPPMRPKIRLDVPWVRRKANRRAGSSSASSPGPCSSRWWGGWSPPHSHHGPHRALGCLLVDGDDRRPERTGVEPARDDATTLVPPGLVRDDRPGVPLRWGPFLWWGKIWERFARRFYGPSERVEEQPFEFAVCR